MTNGDKIRQMSDEELAEFIAGDKACMNMPESECKYVNCDACLLKYIKTEAYNELLESRRDGFFECNMFNCHYQYDGKCTNACYIDCPHYSLKNSLRELISKYEEIVKKI